MDKIFNEMRILMTSLDPIVVPQPTLLDKVSNLLLGMEMLMFEDLLMVEALQMLSTLTKLASKNPKASRLDKTTDSTLDAQSWLEVAVEAAPKVVGDMHE